MANFHTSDGFEPELYTTRPFTTQFLSPRQAKDALKNDFIEKLPAGEVLVAGDEVLCVSNRTIYFFHQGKPY